MFLEIEQSGRTRRLINLTLVDKVELDDAEGVASLWIGGSLITSSRVAYAFYLNRPDELVMKMPKPRPALQTGA